MTRFSASLTCCECFSPKSMAVVLELPEVARPKGRRDDLGATFDRCGRWRIVVDFGWRLVDDEAALSYVRGLDDATGTRGCRGPDGARGAL